VSANINTLYNMISGLDESTLLRLNEFIVREINTARKQRLRQASKGFSVGSSVKFIDRRGQTHVGIVTKVNKMTISIVEKVTSDRSLSGMPSQKMWRVSPSFLTAA
jgi:hypothetical protein